MLPGSDLRALSEFQKSPKRRVCLLLAMVLGAWVTLSGQTFEVGPQSNNPAKNKPTQKANRRSQSPEAGMGWGTSIEVAREARAAREALQKNDYRAATSYASRAARSAPQNVD